MARRGARSLLELGCDVTGLTRRRRRLRLERFANAEGRLVLGRRDLFGGDEIYIVLLDDMLSVQPGSNTDCGLENRGSIDVENNGRRLRAGLPRLTDLKPDHVVPEVSRDPHAGRPGPAPRPRRSRDLLDTEWCSHLIERRSRAELDFLVHPRRPAGRDRSRWGLWVLRVGAVRPVGQEPGWAGGRLIVEQGDVFKKRHLQGPRERRSDRGGGPAGHGRSLRNPMHRTSPVSVSTRDDAS